MERNERNGTARQTNNRGWAGPSGPISSELHTLGIEIKVAAQAGDRKTFGALLNYGTRVITLAEQVEGLENSTLQAPSAARCPGGATA